MLKIKLSYFLKNKTWKIGIFWRVLVGGGVIIAESLRTTITKLLNDEIVKANPVLLYMVTFLSNKIPSASEFALRIFANPQQGSQVEYDFYEKGFAALSERVGICQSDIEILRDILQKKYEMVFCEFPVVCPSVSNEVTAVISPCSEFAEIKTEQLPGEKGGINDPKTGSYNEKFKMYNVEFSETKKSEIKGDETHFNIIAGPLSLNKKPPLKRTYVLEIHCLGAKIDNADACIKKVHELATEFCNQNDFQVNTHISSWPEFQAVISKNSPPPHN